MRETLLFRLDEHDPTASRGRSDDHSAQLERLRHFLAERFFAELYVHRPEVDRLVEIAKTSPCLTVLSGPRGSGKSTIMMRTAHELADHLGQRDRLSLVDLPARSVHYVNLKRFGPTLRHGETEGAEPNYEKVFGVLYRSLIDQLLDDSDPTPAVREAQKAFGSAWKSYRLRHSPVHHLLWEEARLRGLEVDMDPVQLIQEDSELSRLAIEADRVLGDDEPARLEVLLGFLAEEYGHHCVFLIDNVDRFSRGLHLELAKRLQELTHSGVDVSAVLSVRTSNLLGILDRPTGDATMVVVELPGELGALVAEKAHGGDPVLRNVEQEGTGPGGGVGRDHLTFVSSVFNNRMNVLAKAVSRDPDGLSYRDEVLADELNTAGFSSLDGFLDLCRETVEDLDPHDGASWLSTHVLLLEWHNHSLRSALAHLFDVASCALTGQDPLLPRPKGLETQLDIHDFRSLLWRHLVFGERRVPKEPQLLNVFSGDHLVPDTVRFQRLKVLQYLANADEPCFRDLVNFFANLGIDRDSLEAQLQVCARSHGFESDGLVSLDLRDPGAPIELDTVVSLRPAGYLFVRRLAVSCEYLFWCAMLTVTDDWSRFPHHLCEEDLTEAVVLDDDFRAALATEYIEHFLIPAAKAELTPVGAHPEELELRVARFERLGTFGRDRTHFVPVAACRSLLGFVQHADMPRTRREEHIQRLRRLQEDGLRFLDRAGVIDLNGTPPRAATAPPRSLAQGPS